MEIRTVRVLSFGYAVNGVMSVPNDPANSEYQAVQEWLKTNTPDPEFTSAEISAQKIASIEVAIQAELDKEAQAQGYDSIHTAVTYADETAVAQFQTDGISFRVWRSYVWAYAYSVLENYQAGNIPEPTLDEMIAGLPARV